MLYLSFNISPNCAMCTLLFYVVETGSCLPAGGMPETHITQTSSIRIFKCMILVGY